MKFIKAIAAKDPSTSLRYHLHRSLAGERPARSHKVLHASDGDPGRTEFCPREYALMDLAGLKRKPEFLTTSLAMTFKLGDAVSGLAIHHLGSSVAVGDWVCEVCGAEHRHQHVPKTCRECGCPKLAHREIKFRSPSTGISCSIDLFARLRPAGLTATEVKSIDKDEFRKLLMPLASHAWRCRLYLRVMEEARATTPFLAHVDTSEMRVLYVSKGSYGTLDPEVQTWGFSDGKFSPFREFVVKRDDHQSNTYWKRAAALHGFRRGEAGVPEGICPTGFCPRAKSCLAVHHCWSGKYPAGAKLDFKVYGQGGPDG